MNDPFTQRLVRVLESAARISGDVDAGSALRLAERLGIGRFVRFRTGEHAVNGVPDGERILVGLEQSIAREAAEELSAALTRQGIQHFFVKGMALADRLYRSGEREMSDVDLHIDPLAREAAKTTLKDLGYYIPPDEEQSGPPELRSGLFAGRYSGSSQLEQIGLDLAWAVDPVDRLLPRPDRLVPREVWDKLDRTGPLPRPGDAQHVVLLVHHLVHHDMLHFRGLVDLALLWPLVAEDSSDEIESLAKQLGVWRVTRILAAVLRSDLGVTLVPPGPAPDDWRGRRARRMIEPVSWCTWAAAATDAEFVEINVRRLRRRLLLLDSLRAMPALFSDALIPPPEYLRWRWPEAKSTVQARSLHLGRVLGKLF